uniref:Uncharacterized protein n=1 Tax=Glossina austeni TaxID=7395 RepID=A0A1A9VY55_GLOAU
MAVMTLQAITLSLSCLYLSWSLLLSLFYYHLVSIELFKLWETGNSPKTLAPRLFSIFAEKFLIDNVDSLSLTIHELSIRINNSPSPTQPNRQRRNTNTADIKLQQLIAKLALNHSRDYMENKHLFKYAPIAVVLFKDFDYLQH